MIMAPTEDNIVPIHPVDEAAALAWLRAQPGGRTDLPAAELGRRWGWQRYQVTRRLQRWEKDGLVTWQGESLVAVGVARVAADDEVTQDSLQQPATPAENGATAGRSLAVRNAARDASVAGVAGRQDGYVTRLVRLDEHTSHVAPATDVHVSAPSRPGIMARSWSAIGRAGIGLAIAATGAFIAYTSMRANAWFGHSLTPDPVAGEVYSHLSVAAEVIACLIPTATRFYWQDGDWWTALRGWLLMAVALVVVFFAAGGFAVTNLNAGTEVRAERETASMRDLRAQIAGLDRSIASECARRGDRCRDLEHQRADANARLAAERDSIKSDADPQAQAFGISSARLHVVQAGAMVALCLFSGLFISFGAGLIWRAR
jgi:hypothetical protein